VGQTDDRVLGATRVVAVLVTPILVVAGVILYAFPGATERLWAWPMGPETTALAVGGGYLAGAVLFLRAAWESRWHRVALVFPAATVLTVLLLVATLLHWGQFSHGHPSFWAWLVVYAVTPVLLPVVWAVNRRHDPGTPPPGTPLVPRPLRLAVGVVGSVQTAAALVFFVTPATAIAVWPWSLSPLTARTIAAFLAFIGALWVSFLLEPRWSALRLHVEAATLGLVLVAAGAVRSAEDLTGPASTTALFAVLLGGSLAGLLAVQVGMRVAASRQPMAHERS
jgi:hypothetical protein